MLKLASASIKQLDQILAGHQSPSAICLFSTVSIANTLSQSNNFVTLSDSLSQSISHFEQQLPKIHKRIQSCNESLTRTRTTSEYSHLLKAFSIQMRSSLWSCTMKNAMPNSLILHRVLFFDAILSTTTKYPRMIFLATKMLSSSTFITLHSIYHRWTCFFMISIKPIQQVN